MMTRKRFRQHAKPVPVTINGVPLPAVPKEMSTGSVGWNINQKMMIEVDGELQTVQVGLNLTIVNSKLMPEQEMATASAAS